MTKRDIDWSDLEELYIKQELSANEIAPQKNCDSQTVLNYLRRYGIPVRNRGQGSSLHFKKHPEKSRPGFKGGRILMHGYIYIRQPNHPYADGGYVLEHRLIVEQQLHRLLLPSESVHHKNGIKTDNRQENLELLTPSNHRLKENYCRHCELRKEIRLLQWQVKELTETLQLKLKEGV